MRTLVEIGEGPVDVAAAAAAVAAPEAGAVVLFVGTVRAEGRGRAVVALEYEALAPLARAEIGRAIEEAGRRWPLAGAAVVHRVGRLAVGTPSVAIATSAAHRAAAYDANRFLLERLKGSAPIWKREVYADGAAWAGMGGG